MKINQKKVKLKINPTQKHWVGDGFHVYTMFHPAGDMYIHTTPFVMMDFAPPKHFPPTDQKLGVGEHPHRGFETVTFAFAGEVEHRDSAGGGGIIGTGDVQWMTAASGLVHEEFHSREFAKRGGDFEMVQLWVNLPKKDKFTKPRYQGVKARQCPLLNPVDGVSLKVFSGDYAGARGPCETFTPINIYDLRFEKKAKFKFEVDDGTTLIILNRKGETIINDEVIKEHEIAVFDRKGEEVFIECEDMAELLILNGEPIDEPIVAYGPFVMNTREEIMDAINDFNAGKMGTLVETYK